METLRYKYRLFKLPSCNNLLHSNRKLMRGNSWTKWLWSFLSLLLLHAIILYSTPYFHHVESHLSLSHISYILFRRILKLPLENSVLSFTLPLVTAYAFLLFILIDFYRRPLHTRFMIHSILIWVATDVLAPRNLSGLMFSPLVIRTRN